jgi:hypothetical protein
MKTFIAVFLAILAAAAVIGIIRSLDDLNRQRAMTKTIRAQADEMKRQTDEINAERKQLEDQIFAPYVKDADELQKWEQAKENCYDRINAEIKAGENRRQQMRAAVAKLAANKNTIKVGDFDLASMQEIAACNSRIVALDSELVAILERKPSKIPLTTEERKALESAKTAIAREVSPSPQNSR